MSKFETPAKTAALDAIVVGVDNHLDLETSQDLVFVKLLTLGDNRQLLTTVISKAQNEAMFEQLFKDNYVIIQLEEHIADVTGYRDVDGVEQFHTRDGYGIVEVADMPDCIMLQYGANDSIVDRVTAQRDVVNKTRNNQRAVVLADASIKSLTDRYAKVTNERQKSAIERLLKEKGYDTKGKKLAA